MPFKSEKQRRWMWANEPEMAKKWSDEEKQAKRKEGKTLKITKSKLRQIIQEELGSLNEQSIPQDMIERLNSAMMSIAEFVMDKYDDDSAEGVAETEAILTDELNGFMESLEDMDMSRAPDKGMDDALRKEIQRSVDSLANEEVFRDASAEDVAMQSLDYVDHPPSLADEAYEIALAAAVGMGIPREGR